ncbi:MAG: ATP-binding protein [Bacteroidota bacterium]
MTKKAYLCYVKFYGRDEEIVRLREIRRRSLERGQMTVVSGRRRIGKTRLILESLAGERYLYFFVTRQSERLLCAQFCQQIEEVIGIKIYEPITEFRNVFQLLLEEARKQPINLVVDEFQEFTRINPSIYSHMQRAWDLAKDEAQMNLILSGSVQSLMIRIFDSYQEPLYGRANHKFYVKPLSVGTLKQILQDQVSSYSPKDMLAFYTLTGGVPKYVEAFIDAGAITYKAMLDEMLQKGSFFLQEGQFLLLQEFGKEYGTYFSILGLIADGKTSRGQIESVLQQPIGGYLTNMAKDYKIISRIRPMFSKPNTTNLHYYIEDEFLRFWFRFIYRNRSAVESGNFAYLHEAINRDYTTYAGKSLEQLTRQLLRESGKFLEVGNYWERGNKNEIDIVAINELHKEALIGEVKMNPAKISLDKLKLKAQRLSKSLSEYKVAYRGFSMEDI